MQALSFGEADFPSKPISDFHPNQMPTPTHSCGDARSTSTRVDPDRSNGPDAMKYRPHKPS